MEGPTLSISLTSLSIPGSEPRRDWEEEEIRGMIFPRCCGLISASGTFQLL